MERRRRSISNKMGGSLTGQFAFNSSSFSKLTANEDLSVTPTADVPDVRGKWNAWIEGQFAVYQDDSSDQSSDGSFFVGYAGIDMEVYDGVVIGIMGELDWMDQESDPGDTSGTSWMVGPYLTAELAPNLFLRP